jgi:lipopolysaccharide transport system ATP-binding protein
MSDVVIRSEGLGKLYRLGEREPYQALRDVVAKAMAAPLRRLTAGNGAVQADNSWLWALRDVSFEVKQGEAIGIIGRNGAGKSTLLKILSRITEPTEGLARIRGRIGSLLEVGTGFHPELTGRENIFLNGAILGMKRVEIGRKFDEIVAFAETEPFIDTPVKHYSSGMYMRLAFAVAAHLEPEILVVDEVLAVGDQAFQKKCLGKMGDVTRQGRTVLFVSHNLDAIQRLCPRSLLLDKGRLVMAGHSAEVVGQYLSAGSYQAAPDQWIQLDSVSRIGSGEARFAAVQYSSLNGMVGYRPYSNGPLEFSLCIVSDVARTAGSLAITIYSQAGTKLVDMDTNAIGRGIELRPGENELRLRLEKLYLNPGLYRVGLWLADPIRAQRTGGAYDFIETAFEMEVYSLNEDHIGVRAEGVVPSEFQVVERA